MNIDFHYFGTYVAARLAGFPYSDASIVAHAAQYVDDSYRGEFYESDRILNKGYKGLDFQPLPTSHTLGNFVRFMDNLPYDELHRVWMPFHFLPGNYPSRIYPDPEAETRQLAYQGPMQSPWGLCKYDHNIAMLFKLLCLPRHPIITAMINNVINEPSHGSFRLYLLGIRMHALADTGAHKYSGGTPYWLINDVGPTVRTKNNGNVPYYRIWPPQNPKGKEFATPGSRFCSSIFFQGHARLGHIPDYPWLNYDYKAIWRNDAEWKQDNWITKDNPSEFILRFLEMFTALKCFYTRQPFDVLKLDKSLENIPKAIIHSTIQQKHAFGLEDSGDSLRCQAWLKAIERLNLETPPVYDPDLWINEAKRQSDIRETEYWRFNKAALEHIRFVKDSLDKEGFPVIKMPTDEEIEQMANYDQADMVPARFPF